MEMLCALEVSALASCVAIGGGFDARASEPGQR